MKLAYYKCVVLFVLLNLVVTTNLKAQNANFPSNVKTGKCYTRDFDYNKEVEWKEVDCSKKNDDQNNLTSKQYAVLYKKKIKMTKYQEKLVSLGYEVTVNGILDNATIAAHHKYLKFKAKQERKNKRKLKRQNRS